MTDTVTTTPMGTAVITSEVLLIVEIVMISCQDHQDYFHFRERDYVKSVVSAVAARTKEGMNLVFDASLKEIVL